MIKPLALTVCALLAASPGWGGVGKMRGPPRPPERHRHLAGSPGAVRATLEGYLTFYRTVLTRIDGDRCQFTPSCSSYAAAALRREGAATGVLMAADRLLRCNRWAYESGLYARSGDGHLLDPLP